MIHGNWLAKWSQVIPDKAALIDMSSGDEVSYQQLNRRADKAANMLKERFRIGRGSRVAVLGQNRIEQVELYFAVAKLGAILVPANWRLAADEVAYILRNSTPAVLFYGEDVNETVGELAEGPWDGPAISFDENGKTGYRAWMEEASDDPVASEGILDDTPVMLLYTSGTTGRPKGAILTHGTITHNALITATMWDLHQDDISITHTPFFHTGGWNVLTLPLLHRGGTLLIAKGFDPDECLVATERYKVTILFAVPTMFQMILDSKKFGSVDLSSVRFFISGGAACPVPLIRAYQEHGLTFKQGYGLTEVGPNCFVLHERDAIRKAGSVGFPVMHLDTRLVDSQGREVHPGKVGELQLRGPTVCAGYWKNPEATAKAKSEDGWFATGDLFRQDKDGYYYVVDRLKEMFISGGENIYPAEVERVLYQIPEVVEAAVIGMADEKWGEVGHAFVALAGSSNGGPTSDKILEYCRKNLAKYKVPKKLEILDELPKGPSGKILKRALKSAKEGR
jgi:fatty-acyl-CoA synthase